MKYSSIGHINRAQHKRPGASARRERQQSALERLEEGLNNERFARNLPRMMKEIATLQRRLGKATTHT